ncbi:MAG: Calcineurin-like phosphoesterase superfamily domain protein [Planctomycetaceae bacterium]|nr:Calcineurin-like phosphoesterase superfamily domain protein [Planctomycetaceae bacterium]
MKRLLLVGLTLAGLFGTIVLAKSDVVPSLLKIEQQPTVNPWTHLNLNNQPKNFQFAVVTDRTGGHRKMVFEKAVRKLNLLQPEFVVSVGDLIEGYTDKPENMAKQWDEFQGYVKQLKMPFFYVPGNHDISNLPMLKEWEQRLGRHYYHFVYHNTLFLIVNSEATPGSKMEKLGDEQLNYLRKVIQENANVRWTFAFLHKPLWTYGADKLGAGTGWEELEKAMEGRKWTAFCGHEHRYVNFKRNGNDYIQLATTGGASKMRGKKEGEFDQFAWITMTDEGPVVANVLLDGVVELNLKDDLEYDVKMADAQKVQREAAEEAARKKKEAEEAKKKAAEAKQP